jgi:deoxyinosine 3'endonuclease (endonuclease V)
LRWIAGLDIGYDVTDASKAIAVIAVLSFPGMQVRTVLFRVVAPVRCCAALALSHGRD